MAIFKFYQIYRSIKEVLGEEMVKEIFPEYADLPDKMPAKEQAELGKIIMDRMDILLDENTIKKIRQMHTCNPSKEQVAKINELKEKTNNLDEFLHEYSKFLAPGYVKRDGDTLYVSFGLEKCVCGMFRKLETYEPVSKTWCECCNGHVIKMYRMICENIKSSEIVEAVACGGNDCIFKITI
ncbi:hypothetical protein KHQ81_11255 [Mycoplasmatota bacterium]|nr:hypothetical protein KHQ81_11255 [Mycoplasmatota bacterium]